MNSVPQHLLSEDRQEYVRLLDEALRSAPHRPGPAMAGQRPTHEQLRALALDATALITAAAATEYQHYVKVREELRRPAPSTPSSARESGSGEPGSSAVGLATTVGEAAEAAGAGAGAVVAVLAPVLAGTAAAIFLTVGYVLRMLSPEPAFADTLLTAGWAFGGITVVAILVAAVALLRTALRNRPTPASRAQDRLNEEVARAREAWRASLLENGILPFLREALLAEPGPAARQPAPPAPTTSRIPHLGYGRPGFTSPGGGPATGTRPSYSSPDYSSPDFGGPEHQPE